MAKGTDVSTKARLKAAKLGSSAAIKAAGTESGRAAEWKAAKVAGMTKAKAAKMQAKQKPARAQAKVSNVAPRSGVGPVGRAMMSLGAVGFFALFWKEFPALRRYIKIEMM